MENKIKNMAGLRRPEEQERQAISRYFERYFSDSQKNDACDFFVPE